MTWRRGTIKAHTEDGLVCLPLPCASPVPGKRRVGREGGGCTRSGFISSSFLSPFLFFFVFLSWQMHVRASLAWSALPYKWIPRPSPHPCFPTPWLVSLFSSDIRPSFGFLPFLFCFVFHYPLGFSTADTALHHRHLSSSFPFCVLVPFCQFSAITTTMASARLVSARGYRCPHTKRRTRRPLLLPCLFFFCASVSRSVCSLFFFLLVCF